MKYIPGITPWNKGKKGIYSEATLKKMKERALGRIPLNKGVTGIYIGKKSGGWKGGKKESTCKNCGSIFKVYPSKLAKQKLCTRKCKYEWLKKNRPPPRLKDGQALKKNLWTIFSKFIRTRDNGICISCGKKNDWKNTDAGHYIPKTAGLSIYFDERNVNCQCTYCNRFQHGNLSRYAIALRKKYGETILEELDELRKTTRQISVVEYQELIKHYKKQVSICLPK